VEHEPAFRLSWMDDDRDDDDVQLDITGNERKLIKTLRNLLEEKHGYVNIPRSELLRYVIGCKHRMEVAERRFIRLKRLEKEYGLNEVALHQIRDELKKPYYILAGQDKEGRAIIGFRINQFQKKCCQCIDHDEISTNICRCFDRRFGDIEKWNCIIIGYEWAQS